jgi:hypothetical protein
MQTYFEKNPSDSTIVGVAINIDSVFGLARSSKILQETTNESKREQTFEPVEVAPPESIITRWFGRCGQEDYCKHSCTHSCKRHNK